MQCSGKGTTAPTRTSSLDNRLQNWTSPTMLLCFPCRRCAPKQLHGRSPRRFLRSRRVPQEQRAPRPSPRRRRVSNRLPLPPLVYLLTSYSWTRCCVIGNPRVLSSSEITSAIFVCVAAEFSGGADAFLFFVGFFFLSAYNIF